MSLVFVWNGFLLLVFLKMIWTENEIWIENVVEKVLQ